MQLLHFVFEQEITINDIINKISSDYHIVRLEIFKNDFMKNKYLFVDGLYFPYIEGRLSAHIKHKEIFEYICKQIIILENIKNNS